MRICFHDNCLTVRGTSNALYDFANWSQKLYSVEPIIMYNASNPNNQTIAIDRFKQRFHVFAYNDTLQIDSILKEHECDVFFMIKGGKQDGIISSVCENWINAISPCGKNDIHGDKFAMGSEWLSKITNFEIDYVPYMIDLPDVYSDMRSELEIPKHAIVFARNGGPESFDIDFVKEAIKEALRLKKNIYFIFQGTNEFYHHDRVRYLPPSPDVETKVRFLNSSSAFLHARQIGESFGCSIGEASRQNKPIITWFDSPERNHIEELGDKGIYYTNYDEILNILLYFEPDPEKNWRCYGDCHPAAVMERFKYFYMQ